MKRNTFFNLTRSQRMGVIGLSILAFILVLLNIILPPIWNKKQYERYSISWEIDSLSQEEVVNKGGKDTTYSYKINSPNFIKNENVVIDINTANPENLKRVRGIGEVLSKRIVNYREALGGFYDKNQINEVYGINDSMFNIIKNQIVINNLKLRKVNFNEASFEELKRHPYISDLLANQIISFREKVKPFESEQDVRKLYLMKEDLYGRLHNYIEF